MNKERFVKIDLNDIYHIEDYKGFKNIWVYTPKLTAPELHIGYLDNVFFGYTSRQVNYEQPEQVVDYYLDRIYLKDPTTEYDMFFMNDEYKPYLEALNSKISMMQSRNIYNPAPDKQN